MNNTPKNSIRISGLQEHNDENLEERGISFTKNDLQVELTKDEI